MGRGVVALCAVVLLGGCGADGDPAPVADREASVAPTATTPMSSIATSATTSLPATVPTPLPVIAERRPMTPDERARIDSERPLECEHVGGATWDYGGTPIEDDPGGQTSQEALLNVIAELDTDAGVRLHVVPETGWIELVDVGATSFVHDAREWRYIVRFATYEPGGVYRPLSATQCQPDGYVAPTDPPTSPPATRAPYVATTVDPDAGTLPLPGGYRIAGPVVSALSCEETGRSCDAMEALLTGALTLEGQCLYVVSGDQRVTVVWPAGTTWNDERGMLQIADGLLVGMGEEISIGGGYVGAEGVVELLGIDELPPLLTECAATGASESYFYAGTL